MQQGNNDTPGSGQRELHPAEPHGPTLSRSRREQPRAIPRSATHPHLRSSPICCVCPVPGPVWSLEAPLGSRPTWHLASVSVHVVITANPTNTQNRDAGNGREAHLSRSSPAPRPRRGAAEPGVLSGEQRVQSSWCVQGWGKALAGLRSGDQGAR